MAERDEQLDSHFTPEYWDGHRLDGRCCNLSRRQRSFLFNGFSQFLHTAKRMTLINEAAGALKGLISAGEKTVLRTYKKDEEFSGQSLPNGTVVYFQGEGLVNGHQPYYVYNCCGCLIKPSEDQNSNPHLISWVAMQDLRGEDLVQYAGLIFLPLKIGQVMHMTGGGLTRINSLEVTQMGIPIKGKPLKRKQIQPVVRTPVPEPFHI